MIYAAAFDPAGDFLGRNVWLFAIVFPVFFVALWWTILRVIAKASGWAELAEHYRSMASFQGETWSFQSVRMRYLCNYNGCLTFGANEFGMYAAGWGPFRIGAPPLLVPWAELDIQQNKRWLLSGYELRFRQAPGVYMWIWPKLGERLLSASRQPLAGIRMAPPIG